MYLIDAVWRLEEWDEVPVASVTDAASRHMAVGGLDATVRVWPF